MEESKAAMSGKKKITANALYLYCIAENKGKINPVRDRLPSGNRKISNGVNLGNIGVEETGVYTIPCDDLLAVVHNCQPEPYKSEDRELVKKWIIAHQKVVDTAWERFGTILPCGFDTVIRPEGDTNSEGNLKNWLKKDRQNLKEKLEKVRDKAEYGIQISWAPKIIANQITQSVPEVKKLDEEIKRLKGVPSEVEGTKSVGTAFMYEEKIKKLIREEMEKKADECFKDFYALIRAKVDDIKIDKTKKAGEGRQMLVNLSCLLNKDKVKELGQVLDGIDAMDGIFVRFTGPWPPYSFA